MISLEDFYMPYDTLQTQGITIDDFVDSKPNSGMFLSTEYDNETFYLDLHAPETHTGKAVNVTRVTSALDILQVPYTMHLKEGE